MPDDPLQRKVQLTFNNCLFTSKTRERKTVQNERRNLFIAPIIAGAISLFLIALGITVCLLHQATISAVIFFFVVGCASLIGSQAYFWGVADVPSKTRLKKLSSLSSIIKENRFDQDTFIGTAFKEQDLTDAFGRSNVNILSSHLSPQPNRYQLWYATKSTESDKSIESDSFDFQ
ncbi:MAG: hypothetical protein Q8R24_07355 [Legionellaceae bacterium]|nr:hypothetical protein [Legionellaceae bacterium]